jgi:hypothetical protein
MHTCVCLCVCVNVCVRVRVHAHVCVCVCVCLLCVWVVGACARSRVQRRQGCLDGNGVRERMEARKHISSAGMRDPQTVGLSWPSLLQAQLGQSQTRPRPNADGLTGIAGSSERRPFAKAHLTHPDELAPTSILSARAVPCWRACGSVCFGVCLFAEVVAAHQDDKDCGRRGKGPQDAAGEAGGAGTVGAAALGQKRGGGGGSSEHSLLRACTAGSAVRVLLGSIRAIQARSRC